MNDVLIALLLSSNDGVGIKLEGAWRKARGTVTNETAR